MTPEDVSEWDGILTDGTGDPTPEDMLAPIDGLFASAMAAYQTLGKHLLRLYATMPKGVARKQFSALYQRGRSLGLSMVLLDKDMAAWVASQAPVTPPDDEDGDTMPCGCSRIIRNAMVCASIKAQANPFVVYDGPVCACACHREVEGTVGDGIINS